MQLVYENATKHEKGLQVTLKFDEVVQYRCGKSTGSGNVVTLVVPRNGKFYATAHPVSTSSMVRGVKMLKGKK